LFNCRQKFIHSSSPPPRVYSFRSFSPLPPALPGLLSSSCGWLLPIWLNLFNSTAACAGGVSRGRLACTAGALARRTHRSLPAHEAVYSPRPGEPNGRRRRRRRRRTYHGTDAPGCAPSSTRVSPYIDFIMAPHHRIDDIDRLTIYFGFLQFK